jgi:hypothetical protein
MTTVKSDLARTDAKDTESARCPSTYRVPASLRAATGSAEVRCVRPASQHRVHEFGGFLQWGK